MHARKETFTRPSAVSTCGGGKLIREGVHVSRKRVARLMREASLKAKGRRKYRATTDSNHALPVAPNLLARDFHVERPDALCVSDITYIWTRQGWMYLAVILDGDGYVVVLTSPDGEAADRELPAPGRLD